MYERPNALLLQGEENALITGITSMVFMAGFICSNTVLRRMRAAGTGKWGRGVLLVQLVGLVLAFVWGFFEATGLLRESIVYDLTDFAWPLSMMVWTLVVGITVILAKRLSVWGWVTLPGLLVSDFYDLSLAQWGNREDAVAISDRAGSYIGGVILGLPVMLGMVGLVLLGVALWRARLAPAWVPVLLLANVIQNFVAPPGAVSWAIGLVPLLVALGYVGLKTLRMSDDEWERGVSPVAGPVGVEARPRVQ